MQNRRPTWSFNAENNLAKVGAVAAVPI